MADINVRNGGYYSYDIHNSTKIISFNSIFYDKNNLFKSIKTRKFTIKFYGLKVNH